MKNRIALAALALGLATFAGAQTTTKTTTSHAKTFTTTTSSGGGSSSSSDEVKDDLFAGTEAFAKNASNATEITMGPDGLGMANAYGKHSAHNMVLNVVRSYSFDKPGQYNMAEVDAYRAKVNTGDWHCSVHTRDMKNGQSTDICNKHRTDGLIETAIITVEPKELTFIHTIRKQDDKSENGGDAMMSFGNMPEWAMVHQGELAVMRAELAADSAIMRAEHTPLVISNNSYVVTPGEFDNLPRIMPDKQIVLKMKRQSPTDKPKQEFFLQTPEAPAADTLRLDMKRASPTDKMPDTFVIEMPDVPSPPPAPAPSPAPTPAPAPQQ